MNFLEWKRSKADQLRRANIEYPEHELRVILSEVLEKKRATIPMNPESTIDSIFNQGERRRIEAIIDGRVQRKPLGYLLDEQFFYRDVFVVGPGVLIPRSDSEILVGATLYVLGIDDSFLGAKYEVLDSLKCTAQEDVINIMDLCTGSGCIGISIANVLSNYLIDYQMTLTEISEEAASYTLKNIEKAVEPNRIKLVLCDLFPPQISSFANGNKCQIITANPPYITDDEMDTLMPEVGQYEPQEALRGGRDGLDFYKRILLEAPLFLAPHGILAVEHGYLQKEDIKKLFLEHGFENVACLKDYSDNDRVTLGRLISNGE